MKLYKSLLLVTALLLGGLGCATIVAQGPDRIQVNSSPEGAKVTLDGAPVGRTPCVVAVNRKDEGVFKIEFEGYDPVVIDRDKVANGWFFGNLLIGGIIGIGVDLATSNQGKYSETPIFVELKSNKRMPASAKKENIPLKPVSQK